MAEAEDGFKLVVPKRRRGRGAGSRKHAAKAAESGAVAAWLSQPSLTEDRQSCREWVARAWPRHRDAVASSTALQWAIRRLAAHAREAGLQRCVAVGVGSPSRSHSAALQLAAAAALHAALPGSSALEVCDPCLSATDRGILSALGMVCGPAEGDGQRDATREQALFFLPHCPRGVYERVLRQRWGPGLAGLVFLGNSLEDYGLRTADGGTSEAGVASCVLAAAELGLPHEERLSGLGRPDDALYRAFNDTCVVTFPKARLEAPAAVQLFSRPLLPAPADPELKLGE